MFKIIIVSFAYPSYPNPESVREWFLRVWRVTWVLPLSKVVYPSVLRTSPYKCVRCRVSPTCLRIPPDSCSIVTEFLYFRVCYWHTLESPGVILGPRPIFQIRHRCSVYKRKVCVIIPKVFRPIFAYTRMQNFCLVLIQSRSRLSVCL